MSVIEGIKFVKQKAINYCGPAIAEMILSKYGIEKTQDEIGNIIMKTNGNIENTFTNDVCGYLTKHSLYCDYHANLPTQISLQMLVENIKKQNPVMVAQRYNNKEGALPHARLVKGITEQKNVLKFITVNDPYDGENQVYKKKDFVDLWEDKKRKLLVADNEMAIIQKTKPKQDSVCIGCGGKTEKLEIDLENEPPGFTFLNSNTTVSWSANLFKCKSCNALRGIFES